jgi:hypothetical protein
MDLIQRTAVLAATISLAIAAPAIAQDTYPMDQGDFVELAAIQVDDGHTLDYLNHVTGLWKRGRDFAKAQGCISSYEVMTNVYPRKGEPDIYPLVRFPRLADAAEEQKRDVAYRAHMARTVAQLETESGDRAKYRHLAGSMLLRELRFKK